MASKTSRTDTDMSAVDTGYESGTYKRVKQQPSPSLLPIPDAPCSSRTLEHIQSRHTARTIIASEFAASKELAVLQLQKNSVYSSAFVLPQIARSAGWPRGMIKLVIRVYFLLILNCVLQTMLVYELVKEQDVMDVFSGQMWMCDFGGQKKGCPDARGCIGASGSRVTPARLYNYGQWALQVFFKDSLLEIFPDRRDEINSKVDPGDYGVESQSTRVLCSFLFVIAVVQDFRDSFQMMRLIYHVPTADESWVGEDSSRCCEFCIRGIPCLWKIITVLCVLVPKILIWQFTLRTGMTFLLDTAGIEDTIINATALTFILYVDELLFSVYASEHTARMMDELRGYELPRPRKPSTEMGDLSSGDETSDNLIEASGLDNFFTITAIPFMLPIVVSVWLIFTWLYYSTHCHAVEDGIDRGIYVSNDMRFPKSTSISYLSAFFPDIFPNVKEEEPFYTFGA